MNKYKKYIALMILGLMMTTQVQASCNGGTLVTSRKTIDSGCTATTCNEKTFCVSQNAMNWWSAMAWCKANGLQLASVESLCPGVQLGTDACPNWKGLVGNSWTRSVCNGDGTWIASFRGGGTSCEGMRHASDYFGLLYAVCEEITTSSTP